MDHKKQEAKKSGRFCEACNDYHELVYLVAEDGRQTHMIYRCPKKGTKFWPVIPGLKLRTEYSRRWHKKKQKEQQQQLL